jgi:hypothetical protein
MGIFATMDWDEQDGGDARKPWFKPREHGWGWTPSAWQGWAILVIPLFVILALVTRVLSAL